VCCFLYFIKHGPVCIGRVGHGVLVSVLCQICASMDGYYADYYSLMCKGVWRGNGVGRDRGGGGLEGNKKWKD